MSERHLPDRLVVISPTGAPDHYDAFVDGELVVNSTRQPFVDAARALLERGAASNSWLILRHADSDIDSLRAKVGVAAKLTVRARRPITAPCAAHRS
jgi:hypothetical protein